jgi:oxygen-independent coproporphyrinogen-3 oxidase
MLPAGGAASVRLATTDDYDRYFVSPQWSASEVSQEQALEESFFLGLRLNRGVDLSRLQKEFGDIDERYDAVMAELVDEQLLLRSESSVMLTARGRLLSNEVFERFIADRTSIKM